MGSKIITLLLTATLAVGSHGLSNYTRQDCSPITVGTDAAWEELLADGFHGHAWDGMEAIYAPGC